MTTTNINIRMDSDLKAKADALFGELGMNLSTAFNIFVRQSIRDGGIPFAQKISTPFAQVLHAVCARRSVRSRRRRGALRNGLDRIRRIDRTGFVGEIVDVIGRAWRTREGEMDVEIILSRIKSHRQSS